MSGTQLNKTLKGADRRCLGPDIIKQRKQSRRDAVADFIDECRGKNLPLDIDNLHGRMVRQGLFSEKTYKWDAILSIRKYIKEILDERKRIQADDWEIL